jgi:hypothetical protein
MLPRFPPNCRKRQVIIREIRKEIILRKALSSRLRIKVNLSSVA